MYNFIFRLTVIPGPPLFPLTVQLLDLFPCRVESIKEIQNIFHTGRDRCEGNPTGTISAHLDKFTKQYGGSYYDKQNEENDPIHNDVKIPDSVFTTITANCNYWY